MQDLPIAEERAESSAEDAQRNQQQKQKKREWRLFIFIIVFLFPILTVALVSAMGFSIWFYQLIAGPPGAG
ncbi:periplasmic nitrate reductase, NapE protein [Cellvibrio sp. QJXJ]|uniref:periplasmic nitrate reductase, NapE protein n=1 Tax=Cellvibrio sp. QJXJ TaxID=2964606 RepID=UPI0021C42C36|nr:periplasmic nitrate reductase, NapE protein [Cellvibrio sp. QJXJ]UUA72547.1 periplasmic nitrate reductase, NapE protein [Cellvibrio sp. QJXJ]